MSRHAPRLLRTFTAPIRSLPTKLPAVFTPRTPIYSSSARSFFSLPGGLDLGSLFSPEPVTITVTRHMPYSPKALYTLVSDVDSYSTFVPFCEDSKVTKRASDNSPQEAYLRVGFMGVNETFTSRLLCKPGHSVEALSGEAAVEAGGSKDAREGPLKSLVTKWTIEPVVTKCSTSDATDIEATRSLVKLDLVFDFRDPAKNMASRAISDVIAEKMIEAFEAQARRVINGENVAMPSKSLGLNIPAPIKAFAKSQLASSFKKE